MAEIVHETLIEAAPQTVYQALTTQQGLAAHWTDQVEAEPTVGSIATFCLGPDADYVYRMRVVTLDAPRLVEWRVLEAADVNWVGTDIRWTLTPSDGGTTLRFEHLGWASAETSLGQCSYIWAMVIERLGRYAATGRSDPWFKREG